MSVPRICLDFDGVLTTKWPGRGEPEAPVEGAAEFVSYLQHSGYDVVVLSNRAATNSGRQTIWEWLMRHGFPEGIRVTNEKPAALLYIDDRGYRFSGSFEPLLSLIPDHPARARAALETWKP